MLAAALASIERAARIITRTPVSTERSSASLPCGIERDAYRFISLIVFSMAASERDLETPGEKGPSVVRERCDGEEELGDPRALIGDLGVATRSGVEAMN